MPRRPGNESVQTVVPAGSTKIIDFNSELGEGLDAAGRREMLDAIRALAEKLPQVKLDLSDPDNPKVLFRGQVDVVPPQK